VFLLLIFFLVTSTLINPNALKLLLPKSTGQVSAKATVSVSIKHYQDKNRFSYHINGNETPIRFDKIEDELIELTGQELEKTKAIDAEVKALLSTTFGNNNDFDKLLGGMNVMARGFNGERVITNLLNGILPYIEEGVAKHTQSEVAAAKLNREQRRAAQRRTVKQQG
jgi:hypothetical protein